MLDSTPVTWVPFRLRLKSQYMVSGGNTLLSDVKRTELHVDIFISLLYSSADLHLTIVHRLKTISVLEGENCTFDCQLSHDVDDQPSWTINGQLVVTNNHIQLINNGRKYKMAIKEAVLTDAGDVVFTIKDLSCRTMLFVQGE